MTWAPLQATLAERYDTILPDHPGYGASDSPNWIDNISDLSFFYLDCLTHWQSKAAISPVTPWAVGWPPRSPFDSRADSRV